MGHIDGEEFVWCLNAATGEVLWRHRYPGELNNNLHEGGPGSTPTVDGESVYTLGKEGQLFCLDAKSGEVRWEKMLQEDLQVPNPEWGFSSSAVIVGDHVILEAGRVVAYDKRTGKKIWQSEKHDAGYGSVALLLQSGRPEHIATLDCDGLRVTKLQDGRQVAFQQWPSPFRTNATTPIVQDNQIFISSAYQVGCGLFEFTGTELKKVYTSREMKNHFNNSILLDGYLYGFDGNSNLGRVVQLTCMQLSTGKVAWKKAGFGCGSLIVANNRLLILTESGTLVLAKASAEGYEEISRSNFLEGRCWTTPVLLDRKIYGRNAAGKLVCVELPEQK